MTHTSSPDTSTDLVAQTDFKFANWPNWIIESLKKKGILTPTPIQSACIPIIMSGKDVLGTASTGSGKTIAYLGPIILSLVKSKQKALIVVPTRELAKQIEHEAKALLTKDTKLSAIALIGGAPFHIQKRMLSKSPNIIIGTPGRIIDHLQKRNLIVDQLSHFVLDETDRLLDQGFLPQVQEIREYIENRPQTILLSATLPKYNLKKIRSLLHQPEEIHMGKLNQPKNSIDVTNKSLIGKDKYKTLTQIMEASMSTTLVFVNTKRHVETISSKLAADDLPNCMLHGDIPHRKRQRIIKQFREGLMPILVATDVAARGIDITHISRVINYDLPISPEDYIHRIGRSARGEAKGEAINFITEEDKHQWKRIKNFIDGNDEEERAPRFQKKTKKSWQSKNQSSRYSRRSGDNSYNKRAGSNYGDRSDRKHDQRRSPKRNRDDQNDRSIDHRSSRYNRSNGDDSNNWNSNHSDRNHRNHDQRRNTKRNFDRQNERQANGQSSRYNRSNGDDSNRWNSNHSDRNHNQRRNTKRNFDGQNERQANGQSSRYNRSNGDDSNNRNFNHSDRKHDQRRNTKHNRDGQGKPHAKRSWDKQSGNSSNVNTNKTHKKTSYKKRAASKKQQYA